MRLKRNIKGGDGHINNPYGVQRLRKVSFSKINPRPAKRNYIRSRKMKGENEAEISTVSIESFVLSLGTKYDDIKLLFDAKVMATLAVAILLSQHGSPASAAEIQQELRDRSKVIVPLATLYGILEILELRGLVDSETVQTKGRPKAVYRVSTLGREVLTKTVEFRESISNKLPKVSMRKPQGNFDFAAKQSVSLS